MDSLKRYITLRKVIYVVVGILVAVLVLAFFIIKDYERLLDISEQNKQEEALMREKQEPLDPRYPVSVTETIITEENKEDLDMFLEQHPEIRESLEKGVTTTDNGN